MSQASSRDAAPGGGATWFAFNGDADGICAAHQLRLAGTIPDRVVTGVKRDIELVARVDAAAGDRLLVADISLKANRAALGRLLARGVAVTWFDHHEAGDLPETPGLNPHIDLASDTCTSLIVDAHLAGRFGAWAVAAAFGDNLHVRAAARAATLGLDGANVEALRELGELMNYNAYGESLEDLTVDPHRLFERLAGFTDPFAFLAADDFVPALRARLAEDLAQARGAPTLAAGANGSLHLLPETAWARRVNGMFANELARAAPDRAHAVLVRSGDGFLVSVRAPLASPQGADRVCRGFDGGGGRARAAGINHLPDEALERFRASFAAQYG
jgi:hypothetical protein